AEAGGDVHRRRGALVDACVEVGTRIGEAHLAARVGQGDLAVVHVSGEDEVEPAGLEPLEDARIVAEQDGEIRRAREAVRIELRPASHYEAWIGAGDPDAAATQLE